MDQACVNETPAKDKFNELLAHWVADKIGLPVESAYLDDYLDSWSSSGCSTCGPSEQEYAFTVYYRLPGAQSPCIMTINESPLNWLAYTLFHWEENHPKDAAE